MGVVWGGGGCYMFIPAQWTHGCLTLSNPMPFRALGMKGTAKWP